MTEEFGVLVIMNDVLLKFRIEEEQLLLSLVLNDRRGKLLLHIDENEMIFRSDLWDIERTGKRMIVRNGLADIGAEFIFNTPSEIVVNKAEFWNRGYELCVSSNGVVDQFSNRMNGGKAINARYGIVLNSKDEFAPSAMYWTSY
jgi:hypothetical protein